MTRPRASGGRPAQRRAVEADVLEEGHDRIEQQLGLRRAAGSGRSRAARPRPPRRLDPARRDRADRACPEHLQHRRAELGDQLRRGGAVRSSRSRARAMPDSRTAGRGRRSWRCSRARAAGSIERARGLAACAYVQPEAALQAADRAPAAARRAWRSRPDATARLARRSARRCTPGMPMSTTASTAFGISRGEHGRHRGAHRVAHQADRRRRRPRHRAPRRPGRRSRPSSGSVQRRWSPEPGQVDRDHPVRRPPARGTTRRQVEQVVGEAVQQHHGVRRRRR